MRRPRGAPLAVGLAISAGLALRFLIIRYFPAPNVGDSLTYIQLAQNWLYHAVYGLWVNGRLVPVDIRAPGYPAFLAAIYGIFGRRDVPVMFVQAALDMLTCSVAALIAARLAPAESRRRAGISALWLAALCPFTANYTAVILTETLTAFLTAVAVLVLCGALSERDSGARRTSCDPWFLAGIVVGLAALVRPETPLLLISTGLFLAVKWRRLENWKKLARAGALMGAGLVLPLVPWAARNARTLHEFQPLAPRYSELPGELVPYGFDQWTATWLWRMRDVYLTQWKLEEEEIRIADLPSYAFDSLRERERVADLLGRYNEEVSLTPKVDAAFGEIARERTRRHPLRTYVIVPAKRVLAIWYTPRIELLPYSGGLWPIGEKWEDDPVDFSVTAGLGFINIGLVALALAGAWKGRRVPGVQLILAYAAVRTLFLLTVEAPEPRYVIECFPLLMALAAQLWSGHHRSSMGSG